MCIIVRGHDQVIELEIVQVHVRSILYSIEILKLFKKRTTTRISMHARHFLTLAVLYASPFSRRTKKMFFVTELYNDILV